MGWLEIIHVRVGEHDLDRLHAALSKIIAEVRGQPCCQDVKLYRRAHLATDVSLHLYHDPLHSRNNGRKIGLHITAALKQFCMVNHTVWIEETV